MKEVYSDVIRESDKKLVKAKNWKETGNLIKDESKRVKNSIGWVEPENVKWKRDQSNEVEVIEMWNVTLEDGGIYETSSQGEATILSYLTQINYRLMRLEEKTKEWTISEPIGSVLGTPVVRQIKGSEKNTRGSFKIKKIKQKKAEDKKNE